jgi:hypothetical protein
MPAIRIKLVSISKSSGGRRSPTFIALCSERVIYVLPYGNILSHEYYTMAAHILVFVWVDCEWHRRLSSARKSISDKLLATTYSRLIESTGKVRKEIQALDDAVDLIWIDKYERASCDRLIDGMSASFR